MRVFFDGTESKLGARRAGETMTETNCLANKDPEAAQPPLRFDDLGRLRFRDDDIVISTYAKSGTTWTQQIVGQMLFGPDTDLEVAEMSSLARLRADCW